MEDKGKAPEDSGQAQTGIFARIKSIATQNSFVTSAVTQLTRAERERACNDTSVAALAEHLVLVNLQAPGFYG
jgi:hypothetical protein